MKKNLVSLLLGIFFVFSGVAYGDTNTVELASLGKGSVVTNYSSTEVSLPHTMQVTNVTFSIDNTSTNGSGDLRQKSADLNIGLGQIKKLNFIENVFDCSDFGSLRDCSGTFAVDQFRWPMIKWGNFSLGGGVDSRYSVSATYGPNEDISALVFIKYQKVKRK